MDTATAAPWLTASTTRDNGELTVELLDRSSLVVPLKSWDVETFITSVFRENVLRVRDSNGRVVKFIPAHQIRSISPLGDENK